MPAVPPVPAYGGSTCRTVTTGPTLVAGLHADRAGDRQRLHDDDLRERDHRADQRRHLQPDAAGRRANSFVRIICTGITPGSQAYTTTSGPDGNLWFTEYNGLHIGKFDLVTKLATEYGPLLSPATSITAGPDGNVWFAERSVDGTTRSSAASRRPASITEFTATPVAGSIRGDDDRRRRPRLVRQGRLRRPRGRQDRPGQRHVHDLHAAA